MKSGVQCKWSGRCNGTMVLRVSVLALLVLVAALVVSPVVHAEVRRLYTGTFGSAVSTVRDPYPLNTRAEDAAVAVDDASGDVYVTDPGNSRVEKFSASGTFLLMFGRDVNKTAVEEGRVSEADVCPAAGHPSDVCQAGVSSGEAGAIDTAAPKGETLQLFMAVDNASSSSSRGDVYVSSNANDVVTKFSSSGQLVEGWGNNGAGGSANGQLRGTGSLAFLDTGGIAVDASGNLWEGEMESRAIGTETYSNSYFEFSPEGEFLKEWKANSIVLRSHKGLAVNADDDLFIPGIKEVNEFNTTKLFPAALIYEYPLEGFARSVAVDESSGELYVAASNNGETVVERFPGACEKVVSEEEKEDVRESCVPAESFGEGRMPGYVYGVAVGGVGSGEGVYAVLDEAEEVASFVPVTVPGVVSGAASGFAGGSAVLNGSVNPSGVPLTGCFFEWGEEGAGYTHQVACEPAAGSIPADSSAHPVSARITGLAAGTSYHFRLVAGDANDVNGLIDEPSVSGDVPLGPPRLEEASSTSVSSASATLAANVTPEGVDSRVHFEYGTQEGDYTLSTAAVDAGAGAGAKEITTGITGLLPGAVYHYRAVAENALGTVTSGDQTFDTQAAASAFSLLDDRGWELVSPTDKHGALIEGIKENGVVQAAADGEAVTYLADGSIEADPAGADNLSQALSVRTGSGWVSKDLALPHTHETGTALGQGYEYRFFSPNLETAVVQPFGPFVMLSPQASEQTAYLRSNFPTADQAALCSSECFTPLVSEANVAAGTRFGEETPCLKIVEPSTICGPQFLDASSDAKHLILRSKAPLTEGASSQMIYEWNEGTLTPVSVLPNGKNSEAVLGSLSEFGNLLRGNENAESARNAVSADGSRVVFTNEHLYLRDLTAGETVELDKVQGGSGSNPVDPRFQLASPDGSLVLFTDEQQLTANSGAQAPAGAAGEGKGKADLYECAIEDGEAGLACDLSDLTPKTAGGESAHVVGNVIGASENGQDIYFVADGVLASNANANGETAAPGDCAIGEYGTPPDTPHACNLYLDHKGTTTFIARLSAADAKDWASSLRALTARVSPNGQWLAFMSLRSLTGYDNHDALSGQPDEEVFLYHAGENEQAGSLVCASCNPTGARPHGLQAQSMPLANGEVAWPEYSWLAANIPGWTPSREHKSPLYQSRYLSNSGRLFFNSPDALVSQDTNGAVDVYEYEPAGDGSCNTVNPWYVAGENGCVDLVSSGVSPQESAFLDASENGNDVFFLTYAKLTERDLDSSLDVYDARVEGEETPQTMPVECQGDACQTFLAPPEAITPGSLTYNGPGNVTPTPPTHPAKHTQQTKHNNPHHTKNKHPNKHAKPHHKPQSHNHNAKNARNHKHSKQRRRQR